MSRLEEECIVAVVRNRSGIDAGEIDYTLMCDKFDRMSVGCLKDGLRTLDVLKQKFQDRIKKLEDEFEVTDELLEADDGE